MPVLYWTGATDGDWSTASNWSTGSAPVAGSEVIFDGRSTQAVLTGAAIGDTGGLNVDLLHVKSSYAQNIGTNSLPIHLEPDAVIYEGSGVMYLQCSAANASSDSTINEVIVNSAGSLYLSSDVNTAAETAEITLAHIAKGTVYIQDDCNLRNLRIVPTRGNSSNVVVDIGQTCSREKATAANMNIYMQSGTLTIDSPVNTFEVYDGTITYGDSGSAITGLDITTLRMYAGTFNWQPDDTGDDAFIGSLWLYGGTLDASGSVNNDRALVLGNGAGKDIFVYTGATLNINRNSAAITVAGSSELINLGGTITVGRNVQLALTENVSWYD